MVLVVRLYRNIILYFINGKNMLDTCSSVLSYPEGLA